MNISVLCLLPRCNLSIVVFDIFKISDKLLSTSPLKLIKTTSETVKQKVTNFLSNYFLLIDSFSSKSPNNPSVSKIKIPPS